MASICTSTVSLLIRNMSSRPLERRLACRRNCPHPTLGQVRRVNPETTFGSLDRQPGRNQMTPSFIRPDGPVREARFIRNPDGSCNMQADLLLDADVVSGRGTLSF